MAGTGVSILILLVVLLGPIAVAVVVFRFAMKKIKAYEATEAEKLKEEVESQETLVARIEQLERRVEQLERNK
ncbi:MAG TPA: hypothetical protein VIG60_01970 [Savagea sp.]